MLRGPMTQRHFRHRVERTRNKHSRAICKGDTIIIRLAKNLTRTEEQEHISSLLRRMTQLVLREHSKTLIHPFRHLLNGGQSATVQLATGKKYTFALVAGTRTHAQRTRTGWKIEISPQVRKRTLHALLWKLISEEERARVTALVHSLNEQRVGVRISKVQLRFAGTQWGSCSPRGVIMLNTALLFAPPSLLRYVILHELAHRIHANHSAAYWREVERIMPTYRKAYDTLQTYRLPSL